MIIDKGLCGSQESSFEQHCSIIEIDANDGADDDKQFQVKHRNNANQTILQEYYFQQRKCENLKENNFIDNFHMESISGGSKSSKFQPNNNNNNNNMHGLINQRNEQLIGCQNECDYERVLREIEKSNLHKQYETLKIPQQQEYKQRKQQIELGSVCQKQEIEIDMFNKSNYNSGNTQTYKASSGHCNQHNIPQEMLQNKFFKHTQLSKTTDQSIPSVIENITTTSKTTLQHRNQEDHDIIQRNNWFNQLQDIPNGFELQLQQHQQEELELNLKRKNNYQNFETQRPLVKPLNLKTQGDQKVDLTPFRSDRCYGHSEKICAGTSNRFGASQEQQKVANERNLRENKFDQVQEQRQQQGKEGSENRSKTPILQYNQSRIVRQLSDLVAQKKAKQMKDLEINNKHVVEEEEEQVRTQPQGISKISQMILSKLETASSKAKKEEKINDDEQNFSQNKKEFGQVCNQNQAKSTSFVNKSTSFKLLINKKKKCNPEQKQIPLVSERGSKQQQKIQDNSRYSSNTSSRNTSQNKKSTTGVMPSGNITSVQQKCMMIQGSADDRTTNYHLASKAQPKQQNQQGICQKNKTVLVNKENVLVDNHLGKVQVINEQSRIPRFYSNESLQKSLLIRQNCLQNNQNCQSKSRELSPNLNSKSPRESKSIQNSQRGENNTSRMQKYDKSREQKSIESQKSNQQCSLSQLIDQARQNNQRINNNQYIMQNQNASRMASTQQLQLSNCRNHTPSTPRNISTVDKTIKNPCKLIISRKKQS